MKANRNGMQKKGIPWHISMAFVRHGNKYYQRAYIHAFDNQEHSGEASIAILQDTLIRIKAEKPNIHQAYIRSDNARHYHGNEILVAVPKISAATGITIKCWDFSDPQVISTFLKVL